MRRNQGLLWSFAVASSCAMLLTACGSNAQSKPEVLTQSVGSSYSATVAPPGKFASSASASSDAVTTTATGESPTAAPASTSQPAAAPSTTKPAATSAATAAVSVPPRTTVAPVAPTLSKPKVITAAPVAPVAPPVPSADPKPTAPQAPFNVAAVNRKSINAVALAGLSNACLIDGATENTLAPARLRARPFMTGETSLDSMKDCSQIITTARLSQLVQHKGFMNVKAARLSMKDLPADTAKEATRAFDVTITVAGRDAWTTPAWSGFAFLSLIPDASGAWSIDAVRYTPN